MAGCHAHLTPPQPAGTGAPALALEVYLNAVATVLLDGLSYRLAARTVGISKTGVGDSLDLLLGALGSASPTGRSITALQDLYELLAEMARAGRGLADHRPAH